MRPLSLLLPVALVVGLLALTQLPPVPVGQAQPVISGTAVYLPAVFRDGPTPTASATATLTPSQTLTPSTTLTPSSTPTATASRTATASPSRTLTPSITSTRDPARCHPSYPTVCIPPPPPDLNCPDITYRNFLVVGSDPHNFDTDNDGRGCEQN